MIDAHVHVTNAKLPGIVAEHPLLDGPEPPLAALLKSEMDRAGMTQILAMGRLEAPASDPLGIAGILRLAPFVPGLHAIGAIDPSRNSPAHLRAVEATLKLGKVKALKAYLGYIHLPPDSPAYAPYYDLAATYKIPVIFHTGDPYSRRAKVRFAHPLLVDDVAVDNPDVRLVLAHFGNPWLIDAAEVVYKNDNVWADLSGLIVADEATFEGHFSARKPMPEIASAILAVRDAIRYTGKPHRFLYGSDWPLAPMASYRKLVEAMVPSEARQAVFLDNARDLFRLGLIGSLRDHDRRRTRARPGAEETLIVALEPTRATQRGGALRSNFVVPAPSLRVDRDRRGRSWGSSRRRPPNPTRWSGPSPPWARA